MVVNEAFSRQYFPTRTPRHKVKLEFGPPGILPRRPHDTYFEIVGIVRNYQNTRL